MINASNSPPWQGAKCDGRHPYPRGHPNHQVPLGKENIKPSAALHFKDEQLLTGKSLPFAWKTGQGGACSPLQPLRTTQGQDWKLEDGPSGRARFTAVGKARRVHWWLHWRGSRTEVCSANLGLCLCLSLLHIFVFNEERRKLLVVD